MYSNSVIFVQHSTANQLSLLALQAWRGNVCNLDLLGIP